MSRARFCRALRWALQILQVCERNVILQIIPCQVCVNDSVRFGDGLFVPHLLICIGCSRNDGICFLLAAFGLALELGNRGEFISRPTSHIGMGHTFLCHNYHLCVSIPRNKQTMPKQRNECCFNGNRLSTMQAVIPVTVLLAEISTLLF